MNIEENDLARPVREAGARLGHVHVGENQVDGPSDGHSASGQAR
jgi:D-psicose/D-tagatose/L-ribulose 3-epimerase